MSKLLYAQFFIKYTHFNRFFMGLIFSILGLMFIFYGIKYLTVFLVYFGCLVLGWGTSLTFLPTIGYLKYLPSINVAIYFAGMAFAGFFLCILYLIGAYVNIFFKDVG